MQDVILNAFTNKVRLKILCCLSKGSKNVQEIIGTCQLAQSAVSQHLIKLKQAGLVKNEKKGKYIYYSLTYPQAADIAKTIENFIKKVEK